MSLYEKFIGESSETKSNSSGSPSRSQNLTKQQTQIHIQKVMSRLKSIKSCGTMLQANNFQMTQAPQSFAISNRNQPAGQQYKRLVESLSTSSFNSIQQQQQQQQQCSSSSSPAFNEYLKTIDDPILLSWLQDIRFEPELEPLAFQARTCAHDEHSQVALSIRYSQVSIQEIRRQSNFILDFIDYLIDSLPLSALHSLNKFYVEFSELWTQLVKETSAKTNQLVTNQQAQVINNNIQTGTTSNPLTITFTTPKKSQAVVKTMRPLDKLAIQIRNLCIALVNQLYLYQESESASKSIDNALIESDLRKLKELYGKFVEISIKAECRNIVQALNCDFSQFQLNKINSTSSLRPVRPFESSHSQLPLKWALIALWQLTKEDTYVCRVLTEKWLQPQSPTADDSIRHSRVAAKRLDYSTKYDNNKTNGSTNSSSDTENNYKHSINHSDYQKLYQLCQQKHNGQTMFERPASGALSSALKVGSSVKSVSTIELLIDLIISQPNKHERLDIIKLISEPCSDVDKGMLDLDQDDFSISAAIFTSNQYKVAALRILNHLCCHDQAVKTILKCFSTPPPASGFSQPENKIIRSIFECYQTGQEHIYQNETMFSKLASRSAAASSSRRARKRTRFQLDEQQQQQQFDEYSDYGSRQTGGSEYNLSDCSSSQVVDQGLVEQENDDEGDDAVVKEAIRLIVQLTTPFHKSNQGLDYYTLIGRFSIESLVKYLTNILKWSQNREMIFLSLTALANISFITTEPMVLLGTNRIMLEMFKCSKQKLKDLELRDQAVTILANTTDKNLLDVINNGGLTFLLSCLESCPVKMANYKADCQQFCSEQSTVELGPMYCNLQILNQIENKPPRDRKPIDFSHSDFPDVLICSCDRLTRANALSDCLFKLSKKELAAMERIHQKAAVAFARMCQDTSSIRLVLNYGGVKQLIDLCKFSNRRNFSDTVLIACIAALRKMAKVIDFQVFRDYNALDLIELDLKQALEIYGSEENRVEKLEQIYSSEV